MLKVKKPDVVMSHKDFVEEHLKLIKILRNGTEEELNKMADEQENEVEEYLTEEQKKLLDKDEVEEDDED